MAEDLLEKARDVFEGQIDFEGQRLAELLTTVLLSLTGIVAFLAGYITHNITYTLYAGLIGTALTFVVVVPPWPFFNSHPLNWLPPHGSMPAIDIEVDGKRVGS